MEINREELAWAAGFYDGEGSTGLNKYTTVGKKGKRRGYWKRYPTMTIAQTGNGEELHRFNFAVGNIGKVYGPYGPYGTNKQNKQSYFQFHVNGFEKVQAVTAVLWKFMCSAKRNQSEDVLRRYLDQPNYKGELHCVS